MLGLLGEEEGTVGGPEGEAELEAGVAGLAGGGGRGLGHG